MSNLPQTPSAAQHEAASMAHSSRRKKAAQGGELVVSEARVKARSEVPPETPTDAQGQYSQEYLALVKRAETAERQLESTRKWRDQLRAAEMRAKAEAVEWQGKARAAQAQAEQNARIVQEDQEGHRAVLAENTDLRARFANVLEVIESKGLVYDEETAELSGSSQDDCDTQADRPEQSENTGAHGQGDSGTQGASQGDGRVDQPLSKAYRSAQAVLARYQGLANTTGTIELVTALTGLLRYCDQRNEYIRWQDEQIERYQENQRWQKRAVANDEFEAATKLVAMAMRDVCQSKPEGYTEVYTSDIAKACGLNRQAAGRHMNAAVEWGLFGGYRVEEKATVPDVRLGKREIKKKILHVSPTALLDRPEDWKRGDGKQHGGSTRRCKRCGAEDTLRVVPHTVCLHCGAEDIFMPDDARAALDRAALKPEDAQAAVTEAMAIVSQVAPAAQVEEAAHAQVNAPEISEVQDEHQSRARLEEARALLAKMHAHDCSLRIRPEDGAFGIHVPESWSDEKYQALEQKVLALAAEMRALVEEEAAQVAQVSEVQDEHDCQPAQEAAPAIATPAQEEQAAPAAKLGTCLVPGYKTGKPCGSTRWLPSAEEEYVCFTCLSPIEWTRKIERERA